jgi:hypothetical protein
MQKMHHRIGNDNWISGGGDAYMQSMINGESVMLIELGVADLAEHGAFLGQLPKNVRLVGGPDMGLAPQDPDKLYEFEVLTGNACYREGERFYLTPAQARRAYLSQHRN